MRFARTAKCGLAIASVTKSQTKTEKSPEVSTRPKGAGLYGKAPSSPAPKAEQGTNSQEGLPCSFATNPRGIPRAHHGLQGASATNRPTEGLFEGSHRRRGARARLVEGKTI